MLAPACDDCSAAPSPARGTGRGILGDAIRSFPPPLCRRGGDPLPPGASARELASARDPAQPVGAHGEPRLRLRRVAGQSCTRFSTAVPLVARGLGTRLREERRASSRTPHVVPVRSINRSGGVA